MTIRTDAERDRSEALERTRAKGRDGMTPRDRMLDALSPLRAQSFDAGPSGKGGHGDPTAAAVADQSRGGARADLDAFDSALARMTARYSDGEWRGCRDAAHAVIVLCKRWELRRPTDKAKRETKATDGCTSCSRVRGPSGGPMWEPRHRGDLCRWCDDHRRATNELPTVEELTSRHVHGESRVRCTHKETA